MADVTPANTTTETPPPVANGAPPTETPPPAVVEDKKPEEQVGKTFAQLRAREKALLDAQTRWRREQEQERARHEQEKRAFEQQRQGWEAQRHQLEEQRRQELAAKDPSRYMLQEFQREREASNQRIAQLEARLMQQEQAAMTEKQSAALDRELQHVTALGKASTEDRPHVAKYAEKREAAFKARVLALAREHVEQGVRLTDDEILDKIEEELAEEAGIWSQGGNARDSAPGKSKTPPTQSAGNGTTPAPTLTNARQGERVAELSPADLAKLTPEKRREHTLALLAQLRRDREAAAAAAKK